MDQALASGPWLVDGQYSLADVSITPTMVRMEDLGLSDMWTDLPRVKEWYARIQARPILVSRISRGRAAWDRPAERFAPRSVLTKYDDFGYPRDRQMIKKQQVVASARDRHATLVTDDITTISRTQTSELA
jgi:hypothetical protein